MENCYHLEDTCLLFPEEVWDAILDRLDSSQDAWNFLRAFPELDNNPRFQKKKHLWLFGLILPHMIPWKLSCWIKERDLLHCRSVCRHWSAAVDSYLRTQPQLRAYHPVGAPSSPQASRVHWNTRAYLEKNDVDDVGTRKRNHLGGSEIGGNGKTLRQFLSDMKHHPPGRNPFLSRSLFFHVFPRRNLETYHRDLADILTIHRTFGKHVWYYKIYYILEDSHPFYIVNCLRCLPNLRSLDATLFRTEGSSDEANVSAIEKLVNILMKLFPPMPNLESLRIDSSLKQLGHFLITRFGPQIRRLEIDLPMYKNEYCSTFPNLTELEVTARTHEQLRTQLGALLLTLRAPELAKLKLNLTSDSFDYQGMRARRACEFGIEVDLFKWLKRFPKLQYLDFGENSRIVHMKENGTLATWRDSIRSLKFLAIRTSLDLNYNFLLCLPSLEHLQLYPHSQPGVMDHSGYPDVRITHEIEIRALYHSNIWALLPKLKTVSLVKETCLDGRIFLKYKFNRETYEYNQRHLIPHNPWMWQRMDIEWFLAGRDSLTRHEEESEEEEEEDEEEEEESDEDEEAVIHGNNEGGNQNPPRYLPFPGRGINF